MYLKMFIFFKWTNIFLTDRYHLVGSSYIFCKLIPCVLSGPGFLDDDAFRNHILETAQMVLDNTTWETAWEETLSNSKHDQVSACIYPQC